LKRNTIIELGSSGSRAENPPPIAPDSPNVAPAASTATNVRVGGSRSAAIKIRRHGCVIDLSEMPLPPEVLFHRYFQELSPFWREKYRGKHDLEALETLELRPLLVAIQGALNEGLNEEHAVREPVDSHPFHLDYIDSTVPNALAFRHDDYAFIGITIRLVNELWDASDLLGKSEVIASLIGVRLVGEQREALRVVFFRTMLSFIVLHEWTHHIHGHVGPRGLGSVHFDEILDGGQGGDLESQALEVDADGYAVHLVLNNLIAGNARASAVTTFLKLDEQPLSVQDEVLFACFVVAVGAFLYIRHPVTVNSANVYTLTHPPQAERMNFIMNQAMRWCQPSRADLAARMALDRFQKLMRGTAEATPGDSGGINWAAQTAFLMSPDGREYNRKLNGVYQSYVQTLFPT